MARRPEARGAAPRRRPAGRGRGARWHAGATREALLRAAAELFSERGYDAAPIEDVARRAGVNKALISYHFRGKRGLYSAVLAAVFAEMAERARAIEAQGGSVRDTLRGLLQAFARLRAERPEFPSLFLREVLAHGLVPSVLPHLVEVAGVTRRLAERGMREGEFRRVDPFAMHLALVGSLVFFFATEEARARAAARGELPFPMPNSSAFVRYLEELTLRGLSRTGTPPARRRSSPPRKGAHA
jgi:TetR/AcrR family transcriptional regulator